MKYQLDTGHYVSILVYMEHIDTTTADALIPRDIIELWDSEAEKYVYETVTRVEEETEDSVIVYTEENPDEGWSFAWDANMRLFSY